MGRKKKFVINVVVDESWLNKYYNAEKMMKKDKQIFESIDAKEMKELQKRAMELKKKNALTKEARHKLGLYTIKEAYEKLKKKMNINFRAFVGRVERGRIPIVKVGRRRMIPLSILNRLMEMNDKYYTIRQTYNILAKEGFVSNIRALIGRIEKKSIPSVKIGTAKLVPKEAVEALTKIAKNYYNISQAMDYLRAKGLKVKRNAFERRVDRGRIPHVKIGGKRYIHKAVLEDMVEQELQKAKNK